MAHTNWIYNVLFCIIYCKIDVIILLNIYSIRSFTNFKFPFFFSRVKLSFIIESKNNS